MSKSKPYDLCWWFKMQYEVKFSGSESAIGGRSLKAAKVYLEANGEPNYGLLEKCLANYWQNDYWRSRGYPMYGLFDNLDDFLPPPVQEKRESKPVQIECGACGRVHGIQEKCEVRV